MIEPQYITQWREEGYTIVRNCIPDKLIYSAAKMLKHYYDTPDKIKDDFGSDGIFEFPTHTHLDSITLNENLIKIVQQLLQCDTILLSQADTWAKKGSNNLEKISNNDQRMHMDYGNNSFLHPSNWYNPEAVAMIIYLSDTTITEGGTAIVPKTSSTEHLYLFPYKHMPGISNNPFINNKIHSEDYFKKNNPDVYNFRKELYQHERIITPKKGDILLYRLDIWHRGTPVKQNHTRFAMNLLWKKRDCYWINQWNPGWAKRNYYGLTEKLITKSTPLQRSVLGIPNIGDPYWTKEKIDLFKMRYPSLDIYPYLAKL